MTGLCLLATALPVTAAPTLVVQTASGKIEGATKDGVERFLGVPFAKPPVGPLRWRAPQTPVPWQGVRPATSYGPDCVQDAMIEPPGPGWVNPVNEDCLYLNVWRPAHAHKRPLPVMVWIYGGAFIMGAGSFPPYDGTAFARQDVILVNFNYRLGRFGTFAHPALMQEQAGQPAGNYGVLDQIAALNWVRDNIAAFGGDPNNVTIFGESAGASSVNFLMASPLARGLFNKAISQSGGSGANLKSLDAMETEAKIWAASKGVKDDNAVALRALTTAQVLDSPETQVASPFIDGKIITQSTDTAFATGAVAKVPYLVGSNGYEESLLRWLPGGEKGLLAKPGADAVLKLYMSTGLDQVAAGKKMWGDAAMTLPAHTRAAEMAAAGQKVWLYRYSYVPESLRSTLPGAGHEAEIEMVFATQHGRIPHIWSPGDKTMAATVHRYWVNFARVGDPNGEGDPGLRQWPAVTSSENTLMDFANGGAQVVHDFDQPRLDALKAMLDTH
jgi:para-nitrobenzyl esterase